MFDHDFKEWLIGALVTISMQLNNVERKLDTLLSASTVVPPEQLKELNEESQKLKGKTDLLAKAIEEQKQ